MELEVVFRNTITEGVATERERLHLLKVIVVTASVFQLDKLWLNACALKNTAREAQHKITKRVRIVIR